MSLLEPPDSTPRSTDRLSIDWYWMETSGWQNTPASWSLRSIRCLSGPTARLGCLLTDFVLSSRRSTSMNQLLPRSSLDPNRSCEPLFGYRSPERCPDHLLRASRPAAVFARFVHRNRQIVAALVMPSRGARGAARHPIPAGLPPDFDVIQNPKLARLRREILRDLGPACALSKFGRALFSVDHA